MIYILTNWVASVFFLPLLLLGVLLARYLRKKDRKRLVWGSIPIMNNSYWSRAMKENGYDSVTFTTDYFATINSRSDWDVILSEKYRFAPNILKPYLAFFESLLRFDIFFITFNGYFIGDTPLKKMQAHLLKMAGKKIVLIPYGSDAYVYRNIRSTSLIHGLLMSYPEAAKNQERIAKNVSYWIKHADVTIGGVMGMDGFGRWDVLASSSLCVDLGAWKPKTEFSNANGRDDVVYIAHCPNHRGFKGTEFIIEEVRKLKSEGFKIELLLLEKIQNSKIKEILLEKADILIEQLIFTGHGLNGLEGMASGLPTISNLEDDNYILPMRRWSYFSECPLVSASPETLKEVLIKLITRPSLRQELGKAGRAYVEKYQGLDSAYYLFNTIINSFENKDIRLIDLYHPILGNYKKDIPVVAHSLVGNKIVD